MSEHLVRFWIGRTEEAYRDNYKQQVEIERLKSELKEMTEAAYGFEKQLDRELDKSAMLCGQVMRLTKAGDAMAADLIGEFGSYNSVDDWNATKEGKQS